MLAIYWDTVLLTRFEAIAILQQKALWSILIWELSKYLDNDYDGFT